MRRLIPLPYPTSVTTLAEFTAAARAGFGDDPNGEIFAALERARVVGVLDAWADEPENLRWYTSSSGRCQLREFVGNSEELIASYDCDTTDGARAAAAKAISDRQV